MSLSERASRFWTRHRGALFFSAMGGWALLITALYQQTHGGNRTAKGAAELLEIGALPVT